MIATPGAGKLQRLPRVVPDDAPRACEAYLEDEPDWFDAAIAIEDGEVRVTYSLTSPGCPIGPQIAAQIVEFVGEPDGVERVTPALRFSPPWTPERISEDARSALGF